MFGIDEILGEKPTTEATLTLFEPVMMIQQRVGLTVVLGKGLGIGYSAIFLQFLISLCVLMARDFYAVEFC